MTRLLEPLGSGSPPPRYCAVEPPEAGNRQMFSQSGLTGHSAEWRGCTKPSAGAASLVHMNRVRLPVAAPPSAPECVFCPDHLAASTSDFDEVVSVSDDAFVVPALGMMVPGYFLAVTHVHVQSLASLSSATATTLYNWVLEQCTRLAPLFGEYLVVEHGSCPGVMSGSCIDHAHLHLVPLADQIGDLLLVEPGVNWRIIDAPSALAGERNRGYVSLYHRGDYYVAHDVRLPSQWLRRIMARELALPVWDWALDFGRPNLGATMSQVRGLQAVRSGS